MKVFLAFFICIVAVFGLEIEMTEHEKRINEILKDASKACIQELKLDPSLISDKGPSMDEGLLGNGCYLACMDKKIGVMTQDGTYSLERMMNFEDVPEKKQIAQDAYNKLLIECPAKDNKDHCKMASCVHNMVRDMILKKYSG